MPDPVAAPAAAPSAPAASPAPSFSPNNFSQGLAAMRQPAAPAAGEVDPATGETSDMRMARDDGPGFSRMNSIFDRPEAAPRQQQPAAEPADPTAQPLGDEGPPPGDTPTERMLHGMKADELLEALESGEIPQSLYDKLRMKQKINGELRDVPLNEASENGMRLSDYSRAQQALRGERSAFEAERGQHTSQVGAFNEMVQSWLEPKSAQQTLDMMMEMGVPHEVFEAYAADWAVESQLQKQNPAAYERLQQAKARERETRKQLRARENEGAAKTREADKGGASKVEREAGDMIKQHFHGELQAAGITDSPQARKVVGEFINMMTDQLKQPLTRETLRNAVRAAHEHLSDEARKHAGSGGGGQQPQRLPTTPATPAAAPQAAPGARVRISDMRDHMRGRR